MTSLNQATSCESYLEVLFRPGYWLIGKEILRYLHPIDIVNLRNIFQHKDHLILNDCLGLFQSKIAKFLEPEAVYFWFLIIKKTVLRLKDQNAAWTTSKLLTNIFFPLQRPVFYQKKFLSFAFGNPLLALIHNINLGGSRILHLIAKFFSPTQKSLLFDWCSSRGKSILHIIVQHDHWQLFKLFAPFFKKSHIKNESLFEVGLRYKSYKILNLVRRHDSKTFYEKFGMKMHWFYL